MSYIKCSFIRDLQPSETPFSPFDISQELRKRFAWLALATWDPHLDPEKMRGYMVRTPVRSFHTPERPAQFWCVLAKNQTKGWQNVTWIKEMLQAIDDENALTGDGEKLGQMLDNRTTLTPNGNGTPAHLVADKNGFLLALGLAVPLGLRTRLRQIGTEPDHFSVGELKLVENIPLTYVPYVLDNEFEVRFENALREIE